MVSFSEDFVKRMMRRMEFYKRADEQGMKKELVVEVVKHDNLLSEAQSEGSDITWFSDEPKAQGGSGKGASPLAYFLSSMGMCQMVHYAEHASTKHIQIDSLKMVVKGKFSIARPRKFEDIFFTVQIKSKANSDVVAGLAKDAANGCYITNTLKSCCNVNGVVIHNGHKILDL